MRLLDQLHLRVILRQAAFRAPRYLFALYQYYFWVCAWDAVNLERYCIMYGRFGCSRTCWRVVLQVLLYATAAVLGPALTLVVRTDGRTDGFVPCCVYDRVQQ